MSNANVYRAIGSRHELALTHHAWRQMGARSLSPEAIGQVLSFGRETHTRGISIFAVGRKEIAYYREAGFDLTALGGIQVVCSQTGRVITAYRNRNFRGLRSRRRASWHHSRNPKPNHGNKS